jgi:hypothetical protein
MAYVERRERNKGVRYRGLFKAADGHYRSAGTFSTAERALAVAEEAERHAEVTGGAGGLDPVIRATRTIKEYAPLFLRHHQVEGNTKDTQASRPGSSTAAPGSLAGVADGIVTSARTSSMRVPAS